MTVFSRKLLDCDFGTRHIANCPNYKNPRLTGTSPLMGLWSNEGLDVFKGTLGDPSVASKRFLGSEMGFHENLAMTWEFEENHGFGEKFPTRKFCQARLTKCLMKFFFASKVFLRLLLDRHSEPRSIHIIVHLTEMDCSSFSRYITS